MTKLKFYCQVLSNMGLNYFRFRMMCEIKLHLGLLKNSFPVNPPIVKPISLEEWRAVAQPFFFSSREELNVPQEGDLAAIRQIDNRIKSGEINFFNASWFDLGLDYDWITNPTTGFKYDIAKHWTQVQDISQEAGDIKFVWEKSRFSFLYSILRCDQQTASDSSAFVFSQIEDWIDKNPINQGPNYKCSQEISLRTLNWIFALYYYRNSNTLSEAFFAKIINSIYWQIDHVYKNINFSRIAVRNNHAITECLTLYLVGMLFPCFDKSALWKRKGKKYFEKEIDYQIAADGTYLQNSFNYQRVVVQLLTWAITLAQKNGEQFEQNTYFKAYQTLNMLYQCQEQESGWLSNYGANDGALFFKLNDAPYRDFRPTLNALHYALTGKSLYEKSLISEDCSWYGLNENYQSHNFSPLELKYGVVSFELGGYFIFREADTLSFIRCTKFRDRPGQADNLHIDIWYKGENLLIDGGSYKYNTEAKWAKYFGGTESHNSVMLGNYDQMLKGPRFIWLNWSEALSAQVTSNEQGFMFEGKVRCFTYLNKNCMHRRRIIKEQGIPLWVIEDEIINKPDGVTIRQLWHTTSNSIKIQTDGEMIELKGYYSSLYGVKEEARQIECQSVSNNIRAIITL